MSHLIAEGGRSDWYITAGRNADEVVRYAAEQLNMLLYRATGALVPYHSDIKARSSVSNKHGPEFLLGPGVRPNLGYNVPTDDLEPEGFRIRSCGEDIVIVSPTSRGVLYGVYAFLERFCGYRRFSSKVERLPFNPKLEVPELDIAENPAFECRDVYWRDAFDGKFASANRINSGKADISLKQGGMVRFFNFHHAMLDLVPELEYFADHPEYYAEVDGVRKPTQLCLSNPEVIRLSAEKVKSWIVSNPDCKVFSIAQNDNREYCRCEKCRALDEAEGSPAASVIAFSNAVAEEVCAEYPDILLHTFAYQYSRKAPKTLCAHDNVIVRLCDIECSFSRPLSRYAENQPDSTEAKFVEDLRNWSEKTKHLYVWDYCTNFSHYLAPFPNLASLQENIRLFRDCGVKGIFTEGNFSHGGNGAMAELQAYLQARLFWNPDIDLDLTINDFLAGYFGAGAPYIRRALDLWQDAVKDADMRIYYRPDAAFITDELVEESLRLCDLALAAAETPEIYERVDRARLSYEYIYLVRLPLETEGRGLLIDGFGRRLKAYRITEVSERAHLEWSLEKMKTSRYNIDNSGRDSIYYRM